MGRRASYDLRDVAQWEPIEQPEVLPADPVHRRSLARLLAHEATVYGLPAVLQYAELCAQAVAKESPRYTGFNRFAHDRELAGPDYVPFLTPNADTLYSNAWLDLSGGPVLLDIPSFGERYYTAAFYDMYSNASNLSTRTVGPAGGRYLVVTSDWDGAVPEGVEVFRVATTYMWILLRIFVEDSQADLARAHALQDQVTLTPVATSPHLPTADLPVAEPETVRTDWRSFMEALDVVLRRNGCPLQDQALTYRFGAIGVGAAEPWDPDALDDEAREGVREGFAEAMDLIASCRAQLGNPIPGAFWNRGTAGAWGHNHLRRAVASYVGLGATTSVENQAFTTFRDGDGRPLDASQASYVIRVDPPPPSAGFWSLSVYDVRTLALVPNELGRYGVNSATPDLVRTPEGALEVVVSRDRPSYAANWLPAPDGPFYAVIRAYVPLQDVLDGRWKPIPITRLDGESGRTPAPRVADDHERQEQ